MKRFLLLVVVIFLSVYLVLMNGAIDVKTQNKNEEKKLIVEESLCRNKNGSNIIDIPSKWQNRCPDKPVVTVVESGRLGNQMWEYASVYAVAKRTNREAFVPGCLINRLKHIFKNFTKIPPFKHIERCPIHYERLDSKQKNYIGDISGSIILPPWVQVPQFVVPQLKEVLELFQFNDDITRKSQEILRNISKGMKDPVFISVHARRTDYEKYIVRKHNKKIVTEKFFIRCMNYFRKKYSNPLFVVLSDDPDWCERKLKSSDSVIMRGNPPEQDLSIIANCNHSIHDYGTFAMWGAMMAGGETLLNNLGSNMRVARLMKNWHLVT